MRTAVVNLFGSFMSDWIVGKDAIPPKQNIIVPKATKEDSKPRSSGSTSVNAK